ncbi:MAG: class I SAM-dependent methyltransferase [Patescibacteria group bacterium]
MTDNFYERYWAERNDYLDDFAIKWPKLKPYIPKEKGVVILDFGCGNGRILKTIKSINPEARLIGLDVSETALLEAKKILPEAEFHKITDGGKLSLNNETVDFVFSSEVIEHIYDVENAFSEVSRLIKPGGRLLLTTPYHGLIKNILIALFAFDRHFNPAGPHIRFFTEKSLFSLLKKNGFEIITHGYYGRFYPIFHSIFVLAKKRENS